MANHGGVQRGLSKRGVQTDITPARKFRMLLHINPTRQRGKRTGSLARASGWYMTFFAARVIETVRACRHARPRRKLNNLASRRSVRKSFLRCTTRNEIRYRCIDGIPMGDILSGNKIEITAPGLQEGQDVNVYLVPRPSETPSRRSVLEFLDSLPSGPRSAPTWDEVERRFRRNATHGIVDPALLRARLRRRPDLHLQRGEASNLCSDFAPLWEAVARGDLEVLSSELTLMETLNSLAVRFTHSSSPEGRPLDSHSQPRQFLRAQRRIHPIGPIHRAFHRPS